MANPDHVAIVRQGSRAIQQWQSQHGGEHFDLCGADLREIHLSEIDLQRANLCQANLQRANLAKANLRSADLTGAHLDLANLSDADLSGAVLKAAVLKGANLQHAKLDHAKLQGANLQSAHLQKASLRNADLTGACVAKAQLLETKVSGTILSGLKGAVHARQLASVRIRNDHPAQYFETCVRPWPEYYLDWERLRTLGHLPLFGASYTAVILIPLVLSGFAFYNDKVDLMQAWAMQLATIPEHPLHRLATLLLERLRPLPPPQYAFLLLCSTVLLATGATLYTLFCPSRIKEFSRGQWCDQLHQPLLHYWPLAWQHRGIRCICAVSYSLGAVGALWSIGTKVCWAGRFILMHTVFPFPMW